MPSSLALLLLLQTGPVAIGSEAEEKPRKDRPINFEVDGVPSTGIALPVGAQAAGPHFSRAAVIELFEDESGSFASQLINGAPAEATSNHGDFFSGVASIKVTGPQRFMESIKGWNFPVVEKPAPGEYRYIRLAWKKLGGSGIMVQFHDRHTGIWERRYVAGSNGIGYPAISVAAAVPDEWTVVTRDLFADFGAFTLTGMALTPMDGNGGLYDHIYLGRTIEDLDKITRTVREQPRRTEKLEIADLNRFWDDLGSRDAALAQPAISRLVSAGSEALAHFQTRFPELTRPEGDAELLALISQLDHPRFAMREEASRKLERLGASAIAALRSAQANAASFEVFNRIEQLLKKPGLSDIELSPKELRIMRLLRVLEQMEKREALIVLKALPVEKLSAELRAEAAAALSRLEKSAR